MPRRFLVIASTLTLATVAEAAPSLELPAGRPSPMNERVARNLMDRLPLAYEVNRGQAPAGWDFLVRCRGYHAFVKSTGVVFSFDGAGLSMSIDGADAREPSTKGLELPGKANYFLGNDSSKWLSNVPLVRGARYGDVAPGTTWSVGGDGRALEFAFDVEPGADTPRLRFDGGAVRMADDGSLRIAMPSGEARISAPVAWQDTTSGRVRLRSRFSLEKDGAVRVAVERRDPAIALHVDPTVTFATYLGGSDADYSAGAAIDAAGSVYVAGTTQSTDFPTTSGAFQTGLTPSSSGGPYNDSFVAKFNAAGSALVYSTYVGCTHSDPTFVMDVDSSGNAYVVGNAESNDFPTTSGSYQSSANANGSHGVLWELSPTGSSLVFATYTPDINGRGVTPGPSGGVYALDYAGLALYSANGAQRVFYQQIGPTSGNGATTLYFVAADSNGNAYVTGSTSYTNFATTSGAFRTSIAGQTDAILEKISSSGSVVYATYLGGSQGDVGYAVDVNLAGQAYVAGQTDSSNFPVTSDAYRSTKASSTFEEGFVTRMNAAGTGLRYSTYLGVGRGGASSLRVHPLASFVVGGWTESSSMTATSAIQGSFGGVRDGFLMKFNRDSTVAWSSYCGGSDWDMVTNLGMKSDGSVAAVTTTLSTNFPTTNPYRSTNAGVYDAIVSKIPDTLPTTWTLPTISSTSLPDWTVGIAYSQQFTAGGGTAPVAWTVSVGSPPAGLGVSNSGLLSGTPTVPGTSTFSLHLVDAADLVASDAQAVLRINPVPSISSQTLLDWTVGVAFDTTLAASGGTGALPFSVSQGAPPPGILLASNGRLSGTPTTAGDYQFTARVQDTVGAVATRTFSMHVNIVPFVTAATLPVCTAGSPYSFQFFGGGGTGALTWSLASGAVPSSGPIDPTFGKIGGVALAGGSYQFTLRLTDVRGGFGEQDFAVTVNPPPKILTTSLPLALVGRPYSTRLTGAGGTPPLTWILDSGDFPPGVHLDSPSATIVGIVQSSYSGFPNIGLSDKCGIRDVVGLVVETASLLDLTTKKGSETFVLSPATPSRLLRFLELTEGVLLGVQLTHKAVDEVLPDLTLTDATGSAIDLGAYTKTTPKSVTVKGFVVPKTGRYFLVLVPTKKFGTFTLTVTVAPAANWSSRAAVGPSASSEYVFAAPPGAMLSLSAKSAKRSTALPKIVSILAADGTDVLPGGKYAEKGKSATFTSKVPLVGGDYRVVFAARDGNAGDVSWTVKLKLPKKYTFSMPDVPAGD